MSTFVKYLINKSGVCEGRVTEKVIEKHKKTTVEAFNLFMSKVMKTSLDFSIAAKQEEKSGKNEVVTTLEELEGYAIVKCILHENIDINRITYRDNTSYCNVLLDDNIRKTICRLYFNRSQKYIAFLEGTKENRYPIDSINDIFKFADNVKNKINEFLAVK